MPSIRVSCHQCQKPFRSGKLLDWVSPPTFSAPHPETGQRTKLEPGRHAARHSLCRACYKAIKERQRPIERAK